MATETRAQKTGELVKVGQDESLDRHLTWLRLMECKCDFAWIGQGIFNGINMGKGWSRMTTHPDCPDHGTKAQAHFKKHGRWPR